MAHDYSPLVSIITPTFNQERYIGDCIESVLRQTYPHWEQIVIDDGSTDGTVRAITKCGDPRVRCIQQEHQGVYELGRTYNRALNLARGELIAILEGDDFWPEHKLSTLVPAFIHAEVVLSYGDTLDVSAGGEEQQRMTRTARLRKSLPHSVLFNDPIGAATRYMLLAEGTGLVSPCTVLMRRVPLEAIGGFQYVEGLPLTDYPTFLELSLKGKFFYEERVMGYRRRHSHSVTVGFIDDISRGARTVSHVCIHKHRGEIGLTEAEVERIHESWSASEYLAHFSGGRSLLLREEWALARECFSKALNPRYPFVFLAALVGYLFSWLHLDIERLMRLVGRADLREREAKSSSSA
jgi:glycosyltransferase involved in cell wall biosynthesis